MSVPLVSDLKFNRKIDYSDTSVLLVDSSGNMRATVYYMLREFGMHNIKAVTSNERVIPLISQNDYDIVLLSHNVRDSVTGIQILEEARYRGFIRPSAAWICMTSDSSQEAILQVIDSNPDDLLIKPFTMEELKQRIDQVMRRKMALRPVDLAVEAGSIGQALKICENLIYREHPEFDHLQIVRGSLLLQLGRLEDARRLFETIYHESGEKEAGLYLAKVYIGMEELSLAQEQLLRLIERSPLMIAAYDLLAEVYEKQGDLGEAREMLREATSKAPLAIPRQMKLGRVATKTKVMEVAKSAYRRSISLGKRSSLHSAEPYLCLANVFMLEAKHSDEKTQYQLARDMDLLLQRAKQNFPNDLGLEVRSNLIRSQFAESTGDFSEGERLLKEAILVNDRLETPLDLDREVLALSGDVVPMLESEKVASVPEAGKKKAKDAQMSLKANRLGIKHYMSGKVGAAIKSFGAAVEFDFTNFAAMLNLAQLFLETARDDEERREGRLKMVDRYLGLLRNGQLSDDQQRKLNVLERFRKLPAKSLPHGPLGELIK